MKVQEDERSYVKQCLMSPGFFVEPDRDLLKIWAHALGRVARQEFFDNRWPDLFSRLFQVRQTC